MTLRHYQPTPMSDADVATAFRSISTSVSPTSALRFLECVNDWRARNGLPPANHLKASRRKKKPTREVSQKERKARVLVNAKLTIEQVREIRRALAAGASQSGLAREFGVSTSVVWHIANGKSWVGIE